MTSERSGRDSVDELEGVDAGNHLPTPTFSLRGRRVSGEVGPSASSEEVSNRRAARSSRDFLVTALFTRST